MDPSADVQSDSEFILTDQAVAITGRLASMSRTDAISKIQEHGGLYHREVGDDTDILVVGREGWPLKADGHLTKDLQKADLQNADVQNARARGQSRRGIEILSEEAFLQRIHLGDSDQRIHRLYTTAQLSRILKVSERQIRTWVRHKLIHPAHSVRRLDYFDFEQVMGAKLINDLTESGVKPSRIRKSLEQLSRWLPSTNLPLSQLGILEEGGKLLIRLEDGQLAEPNGQIQLEFTEDTNPEDDDESQSEPALKLHHRWEEEGLSLEEAGDLKGALKAYHRAQVEEGQDPEVAFNMGNVLYEMGRKDAASQRYLQAIELDEDYVEAWNNLGNVYAELDELELALEAYERAIELEPDYADAHYNIAETYFQASRHEEALRHWRVYLQQDPHSQWAEHVEERVREAEDILSKK